MSADHSHPHHDHAHQHARNGAHGIRLAFFLNLGFTLIEIAGGIYTNSVAILSDALHDLGDSLAIGMGWYLEGRAQRPRAGAYSYGYRRLSLLAALLNAVVLVTGSLFMLAVAVPRLLHPEPTHATGMLVLALLGIAVNGAAALRLQHDRTMNARVISWHLLEDVLGWAAVLIVSLSLMVTDLYILDPLLSVLITGYILYNVLSKLRSTIALFLQAAPAGLDIAVLEQRLCAIPGVISAHHTHVWSLDGEHHVFTTHLVVRNETTRAQVQQIKQSALAAIEDSNPEHSTIEIEYEDEYCSMQP